MLSGIIITILLRGIPEAFIHMYAMYTFANKKINKKRYILSSITLAFLMVLISKLPISYGIHSILIVMAIIGLAVIGNQLEIILCTSITIINMIIQFLTEGINVVLIEKVLKMELASAMSSPLEKVLYGSPSLIMFFLIVWMIGKCMRKRQKEKENEYTKEL